MIQSQKGKSKSRRQILSPKEPSAYEKKMAQAAIAEQHRIQKIINTSRFNWQKGSIPIIKTQLEARKKKNLYNGNDWKVKFYESKLSLKPKLIEKLSRLI